MDERKLIFYLDWILSYLKGEKQNILLYLPEALNETLSGTKDHQSRIIKELKITDWQYQLLIEKLLEDGFLYEMEYKTPSLSLKGMIFTGYKKQKQQKAIVSALRFLNLLLIVLGTLGAGCYGIFEIWNYYYGYVPAHH